jgi:hypothetical protein
VSFTTVTASSLSVNPFTTLTVSGAITIPRTATAANVLSVGGGTVNAGSLAFTNGGTSAQPGHQATIGTGVLNVAGSVTQSGSTGSATITFTDAGYLRIGGTFYTSTTGTLTTFAGSTVEYAGGFQVAGDFSYANLTFSGASTKMVAGGVTATNALTVGTGTTLAMTGFSLTLGGSFTNNGTFNAGTGTVTYNGTGQNVAPVTYNNVVLSGAGDAFIVAGTSIGGSLSVRPTGTVQANVASGLSIPVRTTRTSTRPAPGC